MAMAWRKTAGAAGVAVMMLTAGLMSSVALAEVPSQAEMLPSVADLADKLLPAVVEISVESKADGGQALNLPDLPDNSPFKDFFDEFMKRHQGPGGTAPKDRTVNSMGSGFIIDASGLIVTNNHVVENAENIEVKLQDQTTLKAELVGRDPKTDIAVIRVKPAKPLPTVSFGDSDHLRIGEWVMAIGNPFGLGGSVSLGIVSARNRDINAGPYDDYIQTDAAINKGNSGGPLFNMRGDVVGINTAIFSPTGGSVGIGFSVPANTANGVVNQLVKFGETRRGWFGVKIQDMNKDIAESMGLDRPHGALVADVTDTGPAQKAGIEPGDVIIEFDGKPIAQMKDLPRIVADTEVGKQVTVKVLRSGKELSLNASVGRLEDGEKLANAQDSQSGMSGTAGKAPAVATLLGMTVSSITDDLRNQYKIEDKVEGAVITSVADGGIAAEKGLEVGDVITEAGEKPVKGSADISTAADQAKKDGRNSVLMLVAKSGKASEMRFIALKLAQ